MTPKERELERRVALMELERDWEKERETYLIHHRHGKPVEPVDSRATCTIATIIWIGMVVAPLFTEYTLLSGMGFVAGLMLLLSPILSGLSETNRAREFTSARERYEERRAALLFDGDSATM